MSQLACKPMVNYTFQWRDGTCSLKIDRLKHHKQHTPIDTIPAGVRNYSFIALFILLISLLLLPFSWVIKGRLSLKAHNFLLSTSARAQARRRLCLQAREKTQAIVFQPLNLHSCLETSVTASGETEPEQKEEEEETRHAIAVDL